MTRGCHLMPRPHKQQSIDKSYRGQQAFDCHKILARSTLSEPELEASSKPRIACKINKQER